MANNSAYCFDILPLEIRSYIWALTNFLVFKDDQSRVKRASPFEVYIEGAPSFIGSLDLPNIRLWMPDFRYHYFGWVFQKTLPTPPLLGLNHDFPLNSYAVYYKVKIEFMYCNLENMGFERSISKFKPLYPWGNAELFYKECIKQEHDSVYDLSPINTWVLTNASLIWE